jgi:hypothetical protein
MSLEILAINSDNLVRLDNLTNASSGAAINNATVTFTLKDSTGAVFGGLLNIAMPYVAASSGRYEGVIPNNAALVLNSFYTIEVTAVSAAQQIFRKLSCIAKYRADQ